MKVKLGVVTKWNTNMGFDSQEKKYINYFKTKKLFHFQISSKEIIPFSKDNLEIVLVKRIYKFKSRYFVLENTGIRKVQNKFREYQKKKKCFQKFKKNALLNEFLSFVMSPPNDNIPLLKKGGVFYRETYTHYNDVFFCTISGCSCNDNGCRDN